MRILIFLSFFNLVYVVSQAQSGFVPNDVFRYSFDGCQTADDLGALPDVSFDNINCVCGIEDQAASFDGNAGVSLPLEVNSLFNSDFSLSFFLSIDNLGAVPVIVGSLSKDNRIDSSITIKYFPAEELIAFQIAESTNSFTEIAGEYDVNRCWNHIVFAKRDRDYFLYTNGELQDRRPAFKVLNFFPDVPLVLGNTQNVSTEPNLVGRIDEVRWFPQFIGEVDIVSFAQRPDQILTADTTIFLGDVLPVVTGPSCATSINWSPSTGVSDPSILEPSLDPITTTIYALDLNDSNCSISDSLRVNVIDPDQLDCENLLLPNAFTPNNDGLNDQYFISNEFIIDDLEFFDIYDRWGSKMFSAASKVDKWNGTFSGEAVNAGNYVYKISYTCKGEKYASSGNFTVLR